MNNKPMLNAYPDSLGGSLKEAVNLLRRPELEGAFGSFYILPSLFHSDLDRGFCIVDYDLEESLAKKDDLDRLMELGIDLKLDFVLNHLSVQSPQFKDLLEKGEQSEYRDFFIHWNRFWQGKGIMTEAGYVQPDQEWIQDMFFRKPGLPILMVQFPDGQEVPYWNTFYQEVTVDEEGKKHYLGQMDLNVDDPKVREFYLETLDKLKAYGASIVRLDAFAYAAKKVGKRNFFNEPETWEFLEWLRQAAQERGLCLLPEIHDSYDSGMYRKVAEKGYMIYDFFLPGLMIHALETGDPSGLAAWTKEILDRNMQIVSMLGCHDGIPLLDLKGILAEETIEQLIQKIVSRGGFVKDLHGQKNVYYQVNATYYSALGEEDEKLLMARAIQMFLPEKPQVWYLDLFAGKNDVQAMQRAGAGGHKEINRTNLCSAQIDEGLKKEVVKKQLELLKLRSQHPAFEGRVEVRTEGSTLQLEWRNREAYACLKADLRTMEYMITHS